MFQRTPSTVDWRRNRPTDPEWFASLEPGWQRRRRENFTIQAAGKPVEEDLIDDGWTSIFRAISSPKGENRPEDAARSATWSSSSPTWRRWRSCAAASTTWSKDPATAEALKPWYRVMCKRPTFNDEYLPCFNQDNVTLVDVSDSKGVERITPRGVVANGVEYEVDLIVYATGFEISSEFRRRLGIEVNGRDGRSLFDHWADGLKTLHGFTTRGFPNWFYIGVSQNAFDLNMTSMFDEQARHIAYIIDETVTRGARTVEPSEEGRRGLAGAAPRASTSAAAGSWPSAPPATTTTRANPRAGAASPAHTLPDQRSSTSSSRTGAKPESCPAWSSTVLDPAPRPPTIRTALHRDRRQRPSRARLNRAAQPSKTVMDGGPVAAPPHHVFSVDTGSDLYAEI